MCEKTLEELLDSIDEKDIDVLISVFQPVHPQYEDVDEETLLKEDEKCSCECCCEKKKKKLDPIVAHNELTADMAREMGKPKTPKVKLINVNKTVSQILEDIYGDIASCAEDGVLEYDLLYDWNELLNGVRDVTMIKVVERTAKHLRDNGFDVDIDIQDIKDPKYYRLVVEW